MTVFVRYPDDWIGVPDFGDEERFAGPREWAIVLADELIMSSGESLAPDEREALINALALMGSGVPERGATAAYLHLMSLRGPIDLVDLTMLSHAEVGDVSAHEVAGSHETDTVRPPTVTELVTPTGLRGALVVRHAPLDQQAPHIIVLRATAALDIGEGFAVLGTATTDLASFESFRPHFQALIDSVTTHA